MPLFSCLLLCNLQLFRNESDLKSDLQNRAVLVHVQARVVAVAVNQYRCQRDADSPYNRVHIDPAGNERSYHRLVNGRYETDPEDDALSSFLDFDFSVHDLFLLYADFVTSASMRLCACFTDSSTRVNRSD